LRQQQHIASFGQPWESPQPVYQPPMPPQTHIPEAVKNKEKPKNPFE
jgi:hypothetical protein